MDAAEYIAQLDGIRERAWELDWFPKGDPVESLLELAGTLKCIRHRKEAVLSPALVLSQRGGDWEDLTLLLSVAARKAGLKSRVAHRKHERGMTLSLEVRRPTGKSWVVVGPLALINPLKVVR